MAKRTTRNGKSASKGFTLGRHAFGKISAVEGVHLSPEMARDFDAFDREQLSARKRRAAIVRKYAVVGS